MSQNIPFLFGQPPAPVHTQHQQNATDTQPQTPTNGAPTPTSQQQMATPQAGLPADFDMSALAGVTPEQFAMIARMIQQGLVPMPPGAAPAAAAAAIPPSAPAATWSKNPPRHSADTPTPQNTSSTAQANGHDVDMDKEEGELEEGEMEDAPKARDFLRTPPKGPRKRSRSPLPRGNAAPADRRGSQQGPAPARPGPQRTSSSAGSAQASRSNGQAPVISQAVSGNTPQPAVGKDAAAKAFLLEMHRNGYNFDQLSREVGDPKTLRRMYQQLGLPLPSSCDSPANQGGVPVAQQPRKTSMPLATKAPTPQNRSEYLAKLQAAKNKKAEASAKSATPPAAPTAASTTETTTVGPRLQPAKPAAAVAAAPPRTGGLTKDKNELLRQKLDKLKAEQAARRQAKQSSDAAAPSSPAVKSDQNAASPMPASRPGLGAGLVEAAARASDEASMNVGPNGFVASQNMAFQALVPSASPTLNRGFGLPGLFTTMLASAQSNDASPQPISSRPASSTPAQNVFAAPSGSTQQPASAIEAARNDSATHNQNFGQSRDVYHDDRYVIEVSSDEEEDDDSMDVDEASEKPRAEKMHFSNSTLKTSRPKLHMPSGGISTTPGTPGVSTPNADLKRKLEEIEEFKRQIAEAERKRQRNGKAKAQAAQEEALVDAVDQVIASSNALASGNATPSEPQQPLETALQPGNQPVTGANPERPSSTSSASARLAREQEKDTLRRRLAELEVQRNQLSSAPTGNATAQPQLASPGIAMNSSEPAPAHSNTVAAPSAFPVNDPNDSDEIDDEDDEDLYGEYTADQIAQPALQPDHIQATSDGPESSSEDDQFEGEGDDVFEPGSVNGMETQEPFSAHPTTQDSPERDVPSTMEASIPGAKTIVAPLVGNDDEMDDEEDLDNLYGEVASAPTAEPAVQTLTDAMASNDDNEEDDSDDAMDTSDASSDSDSSSDDSDDEPESRPDIIQAPHSETVLSAAALLSPGEEVNDDQIDEESDEEAEDTNDAQDMGDTELSVNDDLAPGLQPPMEELDVPTETTKPKTHYTPYESPLHRFKDYRFHPEFEHTVPGGFKSLTYSHKIDSENTLCPFELSGGSCIDKSCTHQHFRSLALSDNELLRLIGTEHTPARTPAEEKRWKNGLALLVKQLRASNVKDVAAIAHRIAEYRRAFREDPTRVLVGLDD